MIGRKDKTTSSFPYYFFGVSAQSICDSKAQKLSLQVPWEMSPEVQFPWEMSPRVLVVRALI